MSHLRDSEESRRSISITPVIAAGKPWTARLIPNNNLRRHGHLITRVHPSEFPTIPVLVRIAAYFGKRIRKPETRAGDTSNEPRDVPHGLLRQLFSVWKVPEVFDNAWLVKGELTYLGRDCYCHLAIGGSLRNWLLLRTSIPNIPA